MPTNKLKFSDKMKAYAMLVEVCSADADGFAVYAEGWNDRKCAEDFSARLGVVVSKDCVSGLRRLEIGPYRQVAGGAERPTSRTVGELSSRIEAIEARLDLLAPAEPGDRFMLASEGEAAVTAMEAVTEMMENFRRVLSGYGGKLEGFRKLVETTGARQFELQQICKRRTGEIITAHGGDIAREELYRVCRSEGFTDEHVTDALILNGCVIRGIPGIDRVSLRDQAA